MKLFILLALSLAFCGLVTAQDPNGQWQPVNWDLSSKLLSGMMNLGLQEAVPEAISAGNLPQGQWSLAHVNLIANQPQGNGDVNYNFNVNLQDQNGNMAHLGFMINNSASGRSTLLFWIVLPLDTPPSN